LRCHPFKRVFTLRLVLKWFWDRKGRKKLRREANGIVFEPNNSRCLIEKVILIKLREKKVSERQLSLELECGTSSVQ
jgi:hypothetical protein